MSARYVPGWDVDTDSPEDDSLHILFQITLAARLRSVANLRGRLPQ